MGQGDPRAGGLRADGGTGCDERNERDGLGPGQPLSDGRPGRPCAGAALGSGLAAGDRPCPVRAAVDQARGDTRVDRGDPGPGGRCLRGCRGASRRPGLHRLPAGLRLHGGRGARAGAGPGGSRPGGNPERRRWRPATGCRASCGCGTPRDHGRDGPLLGQGRGRPVRLGRASSDPRLPQRPRQGLHGGGQRAVLLPGPLPGTEGSRCGPRDRRADGLPPGLRRLLRRGHGDRRDRQRRVRARSSPHRRGGVLRLDSGNARGARLGGRRAGAPAARSWLAGLRAHGDRAPRGRAGGVRGRPQPAAPDAPLCRARQRRSTGTPS